MKRTHWTSTNTLTVDVLDEAGMGGSPRSSRSSFEKASNVMKRRGWRWVSIALESRVLDAGVAAVA